MTGHPPIAAHSAGLADAAKARLAGAGPIRAGLIGAGKFGSMFLAQIPTSPAISVPVIADLDPDRARAAAAKAGWDRARIADTDFIGDGAALCAREDLEVVIEATGVPAAGIAHALAAIAAGKHIVMVNVEADALAGPLLARKAREAGVVYSLAYGDQPALIAELVDWARSCGFPVIAAGKGTKYLPGYEMSTPGTVWEHYGLSAEEADRAGMNAKMFNSFLDGTKSAIEMAAVANACGLNVPEEGLSFPPAGASALARTLCPRANGGVLAQKGMVEVVSSHERNGAEIRDNLRWGVYVVFEGPNAYSRACFRQYGLITDPSGSYAAHWRPYHLIGLELNVSVLSVVLRGVPTGAPASFRADVAAVAKRSLRAGEVLDGEGGYTVWGKLMPAARSLANGALPVGLAHGVRLKRDVAKGTVIRWTDVEIAEDAQAVRFRREMEAAAGLTY